MAKTLSTGNGDWAVQISTPKKKNETTNGRKLTGRKVEIRKYGPLANEVNRIIIMIINKLNQLKFASINNSVATHSTILRKSQSVELRLW